MKISGKEPIKNVKGQMPYGSVQWVLDNRIATVQLQTGQNPSFLSQPQPGRPSAHEHSRTSSPEGKSDINSLVVPLKILLVSISPALAFCSHSTRFCLGTSSILLFLANLMMSHAVFLSSLREYRALHQSWRCLYSGLPCQIWRHQGWDFNKNFSLCQSFVLTIYKV